VGTCSVGANRTHAAEHRLDRVTNFTLRHTFVNSLGGGVLRSDELRYRQPNVTRAHEQAGLSDEDRLRPDEFRLQRRLTVLQEHGDDLTQVGVQLVEAVPLAVTPGNPGTYPTKTPVSGSRSITAV
jgi:hypothetical protein